MSLVKPAKFSLLSGGHPERRSLRRPSRGICIFFSQRRPRRSSRAFGRAELSFLFPDPGLPPWANLFRRLRRLRRGADARGYIINGTYSRISSRAFGRAECSFLFADPGLPPWASLFRRLRRL